MLICDVSGQHGFDEAKELRRIAEERVFQEKIIQAQIHQAQGQKFMPEISRM
jgi:hypothetical protein